MPRLHLEDCGRRSWVWADLSSIHYFKRSNIALKVFFFPSYLNLWLCIPSLHGGSIPEPQPELGCSWVLRLSRGRHMVTPPGWLANLYIPFTCSPQLASVYCPSRGLLQSLPVSSVMFLVCTLLPPPFSTLPSPLLFSGSAFSVGKSLSPPDSTLKSPLWLLILCEVYISFFKGSWLDYFLKGKKVYIF